MKAILTQFIGGGPGKGDIISAAGSGSQKMKGDPAGANTSSFMGLMMGFLGMNETPAPAVKGEGASPVEANKEGEKSANRASILGIPGELSVKNNGKAATPKSAEGEEKNKANLPSEAENLNALSGKKAVRSVQFVSSSGERVSEGEEKMLKSTEGADVNKSGKLQAVNNEADAKGKEKKVQTPADKITQQLKTNGEAVKGKQNSSAKKVLLSKRGTAKGNDVKPAADKGGKEYIPALVVGKTSADGKEQVDSKQRTASQAQTENVMKQAAGDKGQMVNEGKKNPALAADVIKKVQQKQAGELKIKAERGRAPETSVRRPAVQGSQSSTLASVQNSELLLSKPAANVMNLAPGKMISSDSFAKVEAGADSDAPVSREAGQASEKGFKEIHLNEFKSTRLAEAAGRKKFSRHLGDISRQQAGKSRETARQTTKWKQHRFVLKDGKAINISARSADGALQLHLNAGNGELGKMLHQHLQDIRKHVQQELNIKVDLQLQDFSGQHSNRENEAGSSSPTPKSSSSNAGESGGMAASATSTSSGTEGMRYFGFNKNEWTA